MDVKTLFFTMGWSINLYNVGQCLIDVMNDSIILNYYHPTGGIMQILHFKFVYTTRGLLVIVLK